MAINNSNAVNGVQIINIFDFKPYIKEPTTRFAPSPTGNLHIGGLRSALFSYAHAKKINGKFILRIEDTDRNRFIPESMYTLLEILKYFDISPDYYPTTEQFVRSANNDFRWYTNDWAQHLDELEKVNIQDFKDIFVQSLRLPVYQKIAWHLVQKGWAYFCFCSKERLEQINKQAIEQGKQPGYDGYCKIHYTLEQALEKIKQGAKPVVRMNFDKLKEHLGSGKLVYEDSLLGKIEFDLNLQKDGVLLKSDGFPTYHLAVIVDDYLMNVHTTIRGYEWISSIPKHVLVATALGIEDKLKTVHLPIILDPKGGKLSKRSGSVSVYGMLKEGYLKQAMLNYLMTLGVNIVKDGEKPIFSKDKFIQKFDVYSINTANPVFDRQKLLWMNKEYLTDYDSYKFARYFIEWLGRFKDYALDFIMQNCGERVFINKAFCNKDFLGRVLDRVTQSYPYPLVNLLDLAKVRNYLVQDILLMILPYYVVDYISSGTGQNIDTNDNALIPIDYKQVKGIKRYEHKLLAEALKSYIAALEQTFPKNNEEFASKVRQIADKFNIKHADMFMLIRLGAYGYNISPPLFEYIILLGKEKVIKLLQDYLGILKKE